MIIQQKRELGPFEFFMHCPYTIFPCCYCFSDISNHQSFFEFDSKNKNSQNLSLIQESGDENI